MPTREELAKKAATVKPDQAHKPSNPKVFFDIKVGEVPQAHRVTFELFKDIAPKTVENFRALCTGEHGFGYKGSRFFRIIPGFMCQGGDVTRDNGTGGKSIYGDTFEDETFAIAHSKPGILSMVSTGSDKNSSQFLITTVTTDWLDGKNCAFGQVIEGMEIVKLMESQGSVSGEPHTEVVIDNCGVL